MNFWRFFYDFIRFFKDHDLYHLRVTPPCPRDIPNDGAIPFLDTKFDFNICRVWSFWFPCWSYVPNCMNRICSNITVSQTISDKISLPKWNLPEKQNKNFYTKRITSGVWQYISFCPDVYHFWELAKIYVTDCLRNG